MLKLTKLNDIKEMLPEVSERMRGRAKYFLNEGWTLQERSTPQKVVFEVSHPTSDRITTATLEEGGTTKVSSQ